MPYLSMPDPCPHVTRLDVIGARLRANQGDAEAQAELESMLSHADACDGTDDDDSLIGPPN